MTNSKLTTIQRAIINEARILDIQSPNAGINYESIQKRLNLDFDDFFDAIEPLVHRGILTLDSQSQTILISKRGHQFIQKHKEDLEQDRYNELTFRALSAKRQIVQGFIDLAESIYEVHENKLYKKEFSTFKEYCEEKLGFSEKTIYVYLNILELILSFPEYFDKRNAIEFGQKKMRLIYEGINKVEKAVSDPKKNKEIKKAILTRITPKMSVKEVAGFIKTQTENL